MASCVRSVAYGSGKWRAPHLHCPTPLTGLYQLLSSPAFHRGVRQVHKKVHELRHGPIEGEGGGTKIDRPAGSPGFVQHFVDELKEQFMGAKKR